MLLLPVRVTRAVFEGVGLVTSGSTDRTLVGVEDGTGHVALSVLQSVRSVDALIFSVVTAEHTDLRFSSLVSSFLHHDVLEGRGGG